MVWITGPTSLPLSFMTEWNLRWSLFEGFHRVCQQKIRRFFVVRGGTKISVLPWGRQRRGVFKLFPFPRTHWKQQYRRRRNTERDRPVRSSAGECLSARPYVSKEPRWFRRVQNRAYQNTSGLAVFSLNAERSIVLTNQVSDPRPVPGTPCGCMATEQSLAPQPEGNRVFFTFRVHSRSLESHVSRCCKRAERTRFLRAASRKPCERHVATAASCRTAVKAEPFMPHGVFGRMDHMQDVLSLNYRLRRLRKDNTFCALLGPSSPPTGFVTF